MFNNAVLLIAFGGLSLGVTTVPLLAQETAASVYLSGTSRITSDDLDTMRGRADVGGDVTSTVESNAAATADNGGSAFAATGSFNTTQSADNEQDVQATNESIFTGDNATTGSTSVGNAMQGMTGFANVLVNSGINSNLQGTIGVTINLQ